jgi:erythromycin esterase-like protein
VGAAVLAARPAFAKAAGWGGFASLDDWIAREAIPFSFDKGFDAAVDRMMSRLGNRVSVLGLGEALHGGEEFLVLRNRLFQRLAVAHGFSAITLEINYGRAQLLDAYVAGRGPATYEAIRDKGFSYDSGRWDANRELVEWMRQYNADPAHKVKLRVYGTVPSEQEMTNTTESPRGALELALAYLNSIDPAAAARHRQVIEPLLGPDADWEGPAGAIQNQIVGRLLGKEPNPNDPMVAKALGLSPRAAALRVAVEALDSEMRTRRPELAAKSDRQSFREALYQTTVARNLLDLHAALARRESLDNLVSMRDAMAGDALVHIAACEEERGKVMVFLHTAHLRRTRTKLPWYEFWPTGAHLDQLFGDRFAVIGGAVGESKANLIGPAEAGSIEARLLARGTDCFIPAHRGKGLWAGAAPPVRSGPTAPNVPYSPLTPQSLADLDWIVFLRSATHVRGMPAYA